MKSLRGRPREGPEQRSEHGVGHSADGGERGRSDVVPSAAHDAECGVHRASRERRLRPRHAAVECGCTAHQAKHADVEARVGAQPALHAFGGLQIGGDAGSGKHPTPLIVGHKRAPARGNERVLERAVGLDELRLDDGEAKHAPRRAHGALVLVERGKCVEHEHDGGGVRARLEHAEERGVELVGENGDEHEIPRARGVDGVRDGDAGGGGLGRRGRGDDAAVARELVQARAASHERDVVPCEREVQGEGRAHRACAEDANFHVENSHLGLIPFRGQVG